MKKPVPAQPVPKTRKRKPIELLKEVVKVIRAEPLRYRQSAWLYNTSDFHPSDPKPACNTVGCVAGWVAALTRTGNQLPQDGAAVHRQAATALRLTPDQQMILFDARPNDRFDRLTPGTRAYVEAGVAHIETFMRGELGYTGPKL